VNRHIKMCLHTSDIEEKLEHIIIVSRGTINQWPNDTVTGEESYASTMSDKYDVLVTVIQ
jgi:hypothetical protein